MAQNNKQLLKSLTQAGNASSGFSKPNAISKLREAMLKQMKTVKSKQVVDVTFFAIGILVMYKFGKLLAETIDNQMPSEKSMMDMMR